MWCRGGTASSGVFRQTRIPARAKTPHPGCRAVLQLRMIFTFPAPGGCFECAQLFLPADFTLGDLGQEGTALSLTEKLINVGKQFFRERNMGALLCHGTAPRVDGQLTLHEPSPLVKQNPAHTSPAHHTVTSHNLFYGTRRNVSCGWMQPETTSTNLMRLRGQPETPRPHNGIWFRRKISALLPKAQGCHKCLTFLNLAIMLWFWSLNR